MSGGFVTGIIVGLLAFYVYSQFRQKYEIKEREKDK